MYSSFSSLGKCRIDHFFTDMTHVSPHKVSRLIVDCETIAIDSSSVSGQILDRNHDDDDAGKQQLSRPQPKLKDLVAWC